MRLIFAVLFLFAADCYGQKIPIVELRENFQGDEFKEQAMAWSTMADHMRNCRDNKKLSFAIIEVVDEWPHDYKKQLEELKKVDEYEEIFALDYRGKLLKQDLKISGLRKQIEKLKARIKELEGG